MLNTGLLARPFSYDRPRVSGYEPIITGKVTRINRRKRNSWRSEALVNDCVMSTSHHDTKAAAESHCADMIKAYAEAHYRAGVKPAQAHNPKAESQCFRGKRKDKQMARGHSNPNAGETKPHPTRSDVAIVPIAGGATINTVRDLPTLALQRDEWQTIGEHMGWWTRPGKPGGGTLWIEFHDREKRIEVEELTFEGIHAAKYQCEQMLEELEEAQEKLDAAE